MLVGLSHFAVNIRLLIVLILLSGVVFVAIIAAIVLIRLWLLHRAERRDAEELARERFRPDGEPYPPTARGICDRCGAAFEEVYYLPSGERLCPRDYGAMYVRRDVEPDEQTSDPRR